MSINKVRVREQMEKQNIKTQTELAEKLGISKNQLSLILSERYEPVKAKVIEMCDILDISPLDIFDKQTYESSDPFSADNFITIENSVTAIELFAGAGGLALGLEKADIDTKLFVEIDKYCCETLKTNRPKWNVVAEDIKKVSFKKFKNKIDVVTGGFPCQAFSYAGKKLGFEDTRGTLFYEFARCIKEVSPLIFVAENVRGLISHDGGKTLTTILDIFSSLGYDVEYKLLNAVNFGVPQKRQRVVIVGTRAGINFEFPKADDNVVTLAEALKDVPKSEGQEYSESKRKVLDLVPAGGCWRDLPDNIQKKFMGKSYYSGGGRTGMARRIAWDEPCLTLTCSPSQKQTERCHPDETRPFTVREYARIQSFPDDWEFSGGLSQKYKQVGNAVPVELAHRIGVQIVKAVQEYKQKTKANH